ncbi:hypothetical protein [Luteolibacter sp. LG18]|uniref:hypothetical protein n=1 Tax=Luteolibacter sp. LG18 TaxID=2819286 RepID=UPI002B30EBD6|nr:hypothetical protein llg_09570 [Luteolibacter sp. LG18]
MTAVQYIANIVKRPGLYWGNSDNNFQSFVAYWHGISSMQCEVPGFHRTIPGGLIPIHFTPFVREQIAPQSSLAGNGWMTFIERLTHSDTEALELLLKLRELYESSRFPALDEEMIQELEAKERA